MDEVVLASKRGEETGRTGSIELSVEAINVAWNKFFRTLGLAFVAEMLSLQEAIPPRQIPMHHNNNNNNEETNSGEQNIQQQNYTNGTLK